MSRKSIYCILGGSGTGKTYLAHQLTSILDASTISTDKFRAVLQQKRTKDDPINLLLHEDTYIEYSQEELLTIHKKISIVTCSFILSTFSDYFERDKNLILEGDDLTPQLVTELSSIYKVRPICLYEEGEKVIDANIRQRDKSLADVKTSIVKSQLKHAYLNGLRIKQESEEATIPIITARPYETLIKRAMLILS